MTAFPKMFPELLALCRRKQQATHKIYIQTHNFPDPDAIATAYGLQRLLITNGVQATICYEGRIDKLSTAKMLNAFDIEMFEYDELRSVMAEDDSIICVDSQKLAGNITDFIGDEVACVDHHPTYVPIEYEFSDIRIVGACATLITGYYQEMGQVPSRDVATALLYGLKMDTAQFARGVTPLDIEAFGYLFPLIDTGKLAMLEMNNLELKDLKAYGATIENIALDGFFGFSVIPFSCTDVLVATLSDFILSLAEVDVSVVCSVRPDGLKFSIRSLRQEIHAGKLINRALASIGSGGGHAAMAGGFVKHSEVEKLGLAPHDALRQRFLRAWREQRQI